MKNFWNTLERRESIVMTFKFCRKCVGVRQKDKNGKCDVCGVDL